MNDSKNQLHAAGARRTAVPPRLRDPKACSNAFGDNPVRVLVPLLEFNQDSKAAIPAAAGRQVEAMDATSNFSFGFWLALRCR